MEDLEFNWIPLGYAANLAIAAEYSSLCMLLSEWSDEILVPSANVVGYQLVYEAETWLRRICLASLLTAQGPAWASILDSRLRKQLEGNSRRNGQRWYLGVDADEELLWSTTHGQLASLLRLEAIAETCERLSGVPAEVLATRLESVAQVRNALAHNRAISDDTLTVLRGDLAVVRSAASRFKRHTLYARSEITSFAQSPVDLERLISEFETRAAALSGQQLFVAANEDFVFLVRLPVPPFGRWPDAAKLRAAVGIASHLMVCVLANKQGDELQFVMPRRLSTTDQIEVARRFLTSSTLQSGWTHVPPDEQHPADVCWPRLWFYENSEPTR
jgi:hypothetical protein